jgi:hypothetical protein
VLEIVIDGLTLEAVESNGWASGSCPPSCVSPGSYGYLGQFRSICIRFGRANPQITLMLEKPPFMEADSITPDASLARPRLRSPACPSFGQSGAIWAASLTRGDGGAEILVEGDLAG